MTPADFFRLHGLIVDQPRDDAKWHRVPTEDHPKKKNGAYLLDGDRAVCQNWATMTKPEVMRDDSVRTITPEDRAKAAARRAAAQETQEKQWSRAADRAAQLLATCRPGNHGYLMRKGFEGDQGLVLPDGALFVPMRSLRDNALVGAQVIRWLTEPREWEKKFLPGMRSRLAVYRLGKSMPRELVLVEGLATAMSLMLAIDQLRLNMGVLVCFSASNILAVAAELAGSPVRTFVFADNDAPQLDPEKAIKNPGEAGQRAARSTGLPWVMSDRVGEDANDMHRRAGLLALSGKVMQLRKAQPNAWRPHWPDKAEA